MKFVPHKLKSVTLQVEIGTVGLASDSKMAHSNLRMGHSSCSELDHVDQLRNLANTVTEDRQSLRQHAFMEVNNYSAY
jgi:hypothetical protein